jgi:hypothetical protein
MPSPCSTERQNAAMERFTSPALQEVQQLHANIVIATSRVRAERSHARARLPRPRTCAGRAHRPGSPQRTRRAAAHSPPSGDDSDSGDSDDHERARPAAGPSRLPEVVVA